MYSYDKYSYDKNDIIGSGSFGEVYRGKYTSSQGQIDVAIKVIKRVGKKEFEILKDVRGKHVVKVYSIVEGRNDEYIIIMELCEKTLSFKQFKKYSLRNKFNICCQMIDAIYELHVQNIQHMDIKPNNFLICESDTVKITDFGLSDDVSVRMRYSGTMKYVAPEVAFNGYKMYDPYMADIYSLGASMLMFITGLEQLNLVNKSINHDTTMATSNNKDTVLALGIARELNFDNKKTDQLPSDFTDLIRSMMSINPIDRPNCYDLKRSNFYIKYANK